MESHEAGDHGGYLRLRWKTRLYVLLVGAMPEVGQVMGRMWALDPSGPRLKSWLCVALGRLSNLSVFGYNIRWVQK